MKLAYSALNVLFHAFHILIISFVVVGWVIPQFRVAHLALCLATLGSWFILGRWLGRGYCPVSDWHWKIKDALGNGRPRATYIHHLLTTAIGLHFRPETVDRVVVITTLILTGLSIALNVRDIMPL